MPETKREELPSGVADLSDPDLDRNKCDERHCKKDRQPDQMPTQTPKAKDENLNDQHPSVSPCLGP